MIFGWVERVDKLIVIRIFLFSYVFIFNVFMYFICHVTKKAGMYYFLFFSDTLKAPR